MMRLHANMLQFPHRIETIVTDYESSTDNLGQIAEILGPHTLALDSMKKGLILFLSLWMDHLFILFITSRS